MESPSSVAAVIDYFLTQLTIHVSGVPTHSQPLELFYPQHHPYPRQSLRIIPSDLARDGHALVQDKDVVSIWKLPSMVAAYEVFFWEKTFEAALARETMLIAAETFLGDDESACWEDEALLHGFSEFLTALGTKPVTIPIPIIVDDMLETFRIASIASPALQAFSWAHSSDLRATLEAFVRTRECFLYLEGHLPVAEVTFGQPIRQSTEDLVVELHYTWNPPTVNFEGLQNVYDESRSFHLKPTMDRPCEDLDVVYDVEPNGSIVTWNASEGQFEGHCTPALASIAGAQRLESFTMPLNMTAEFTMSLPGEIMFERTIRLAIPITIKRKPETCSSDQELDESPVVRRPAVSVRIPSTNTTPGSVVKCSAARGVEKENTSPDYKEEATAPSPNTRKVQCWVLDVDASGEPPEETTQGEATEPHAAQERAEPPPVHEHASGEPSSIPRRERLPLQPTSGNRKRNPPPSDEIDFEKRKSPRTADVLSPGNKGKGKRRDSVVTEQTSCETKSENSPSEPIVRVDSPFGVVYSSAHTDRALLQSNADELRAILEEFRQIAGSQHRHEASSRAARRPRNPLQNWREAPERLNEAEKDALQDAIREAHRGDLEAQLRSSQESSEESEVDAWDDVAWDDVNNYVENFIGDCDGDGDADDAEYEEEFEEEYEEMDVKW